MPLAIRACCAAAARTHAGSNRPVGYVKRSCQYCSNSASRAASPCRSLPGTGMYRAGCDTRCTVLSLAANMASARPAKHTVNPSSARGLKNPASPTLLREDSRSERRLSLSGVRYLFFIVLDLLYGRAFFRRRNGYPRAGTARRPIMLCFRKA